MSITKAQLEELCDAKNKLCDFCNVDNCEICVITDLIRDAFNECDELQEK